MTAPADLEPPEGLGFGFGLVLGSGLGLGWSGSTCKVGIDVTHSAQSFLQDAAAHGAGGGLCTRVFVTLSWHPLRGRHGSGLPGALTVTVTCGGQCCEPQTDIPFFEIDRKRPFLGRFFGCQNRPKPETDY